MNVLNFHLALFFEHTYGSQYRYLNEHQPIIVGYTWRNIMKYSEVAYTWPKTPRFSVRANPRGIRSDTTCWMIDFIVDFKLTDYKCEIILNRIS